MSFFRVEAEPVIPVGEVRVFAEGLDHPEGLAFDADGVLWTGGEAGQIYSITPEGRVSQVGRTGGFCLGLTFSRAQELYVCDLTRHAILRMDRSGSVLGVIGDAGGRKLLTPNFSLFDAEDNLYFTDSGTWTEVNGFVYRMRPNGQTEVFAGPFAFPNGMALSAAGDTLFVVESTRNRVLSIPIAADGSAGEAKVFVAGLERIPDGAALDAAGNLLVTCYATDCIYSVSPTGEAQLLLFDPEGTRLARPTNIAFGGPGNRDMFIANLGRWHISRVTGPTPGSMLANQIQKGASLQ